MTLRAAIWPAPRGLALSFAKQKAWPCFRTPELCSGCGCGFQEAECCVTDIMKKCPRVSFQSEDRRKPCGRNLTSCPQLAFSVTCMHHVSPRSAAIGACPPAQSQAWPHSPPRSPLRRAVLLFTARRTPPRLPAALVRHRGEAEGLLPLLLGGFPQGLPCLPGWPTPRQDSRPPGLRAVILKHPCP